MYGQVDFLDGMISLAIGKLIHDDYQLGSECDSDWMLWDFTSDSYSIDAATGALVRFFPMDGLNIGLLFVPSKLGLDSFGVFARYDMEDVFSFILASRFTDPVGDMFLSATVDLKLVEGLRLAPGFKLNGGTLNGATGAFLIAGYSTDSFVFDVIPEFEFDPMDLYIELFIGYTINDTLSLHVPVMLSMTNDFNDFGYAFGIELWKRFGPSRFEFGVSFDGDVISIPFVVRASF
jgi:hypothetical protein